MDERQALEGIAAADAHLGRRVPLPAVELPLARWVEVVALGPGAVEIAWNLDDSRTGAPGRLALYAGLHVAPDRGLPAPEVLGRYGHRTSPLTEAEAGLRPVHELAWQHDGLHLRLTGQGPWSLQALITLADATG